MTEIISANALLQALDNLIPHTDRKEPYRAYKHRFLRLINLTPDVYALLGELVLDSEHVRDTVLAELSAQRENEYLSTELEVHPPMKPGVHYYTSANSVFTQRMLSNICVSTGSSSTIHCRTFIKANHVDRVFRSSAVTSPMVNRYNMIKDVEYMQNLEHTVLDNVLMAIHNDYVVHERGVLNIPVPVDFDALMSRDSCESHIFELMVQGYTVQNILERIIFRYWFRSSNADVIRSYWIGTGVYLSTRESKYFRS